MEDLEYQYQVKENIVRGFVQLLPKGAAIDKILFSMKDARASGEIEQTYEFIKSKLSDIKLEQFKEINDIQKIKSLLEIELGDLNVLVSNFILFTKTQSSFNTEIKKILEENKSDIKSILQGVTELLSRPAVEIDKDVLKLLFNNLFELYKVQMKEMHYDKVLENIDSIKKLKGYDNMDPTLKGELNSYAAEIHLRLGNDSLAQKLTQQILLAKIYSLKICNYLMYYATILNDKSLFDKVYSIYPQYCTDNKKVTKHLVFWDYVHKNYLSVIKKLCEDELHPTLKEEYQDSAELNFYLGMSLFDLKRYKEAQVFLTSACNLEKSIPFQFYLQLSYAFIIIDRRAAIFLLTQPEKEALKEIYSKLKSSEFNGYFQRSVPDAQKDYWIQRLIITAHFDPQLALEDYSQVPENIKQLNTMKSVYADLLYFNNNFDEALKTLIDLYKLDPDINQATKILSSFLSLGKYKEALDFESQIKEYDEEGVVYSLLIVAFSKLNSLEDSIKYAESFLPSVKYPIYVHKAIGELYSEHINMEKAYDYYDLMIKSIPVDDFPPRLLLARFVRSKGYIDLAINCLEPFTTYNDEAQRMYVYDVIRNGTDEQKNKADKIIDGKLNTSNDIEFWLGSKVELEFNRQHYNTCAGYLKKLFELIPNPNVAYKYAHVKIILGDKDLLDIAQILERDRNPYTVMMGANCYYKMGL